MEDTRTWRRFTREGGRVAHTLRGNRPHGTMGAVCRISLSLAAEHIAAPDGMRDCKRCAALRDSSHSPGEKIEPGEQRSLYDPGPREAA